MAKLIYDGSRNRPGIIARNTNGVVVFDELQNGHDRRNVSELAGQLKQVMESGRIERLSFQAETDASIVFVVILKNMVIKSINFYQVHSVKLHFYLEFQDYWKGTICQHYKEERFH